MLTIVVGVLLFAVGFLLGHGEGARVSCRVTEAVVPLSLREKALLSGKCPTCDYDYRIVRAGFKSACGEDHSITLKEESNYADSANRDATGKNH